MTGSIFTPEQMLKVGKATVEHNNQEAYVYGTVGTLVHFGFIAEVGGVDLGAAGSTVTASRDGHTRSRWLGDTTGFGVSQNNATILKYPSRRGNALPGRPFKIQDLETEDIWTLHLSGEWGILVAWMLENRPPMDVQLWGLTGNRMDSPILAQAA